MVTYARDIIGYGATPSDKCIVRLRELCADGR